MKNLDWKKIGVIGFLIYLLGLPIAIWRSSKIGKVIFISILVVCIGNLLSFVTKKALQTYYSIDSIVQVDSKSKAVIESINNLQNEVYSTKTKLNKLRSESKSEIEQKKQSQIDSIIKKSQKIESDLSEIEKSVKALKNELRESFLDRVIHLRENILVKNYSKETYEVRKELSDLLETTSLLSETEKERFYNELKTIGFEVVKHKEKVKTIVPRIYTMNYPMMSSDASSVYIGRGYVQNQEEEDEQ